MRSINSSICIDKHNSESELQAPINPQTPLSLFVIVNTLDFVQYTNNWIKNLYMTFYLFAGEGKVMFSAPFCFPAQSSQTLAAVQNHPPGCRRPSCPPKH